MSLRPPAVLGARGALPGLQGDILKAKPSGAIPNVPTVCVDDPETKQCVKPYHNPEDVNAGGPHGGNPAKTDIDGGKMDGFIAAFREGSKACKGKSADTPGCSFGKTPDVMGWHDARDIPNYWAYAQNSVLQDKMFEPNAS